MDDINAMVTAILVNNNIASYIGAYLLTGQLALSGVPHAELAATLLITPVFFVFAESLPKQLAYVHPDRLALGMVGFFRFLAIAFHPLIKLLNLLSNGLHFLFHSPNRTDFAPSRRALLMEHLRAGVADNILSEEQNRMAVRIMQLESISIGDCMIPLHGLCRIPADASRRVALECLSKRREHRDLPAILVDAEGRPTGMSTTLAAMALSPGGPEDPIAPATERLERLRTGQAIPEALRLFRSRRAGYAMVVANGRPAGLITARGILDRIAGM
jgi:putative hemolysin